MLDPKPELEKTSVYFNIDNGTGKIRGVWMQGNDAVRPIFEAWIRPLKDLGVELLGPRSVASTDHTNFDALGIPAFQFIQERLEYNSRTHHSNMDFLDRVQAEDMKQIATVAAVFAWQAANRAQLLPQKTLMPWRQVIVFRIGCFAALLTASVHMIGHASGTQPPANETERQLLELMATLPVSFPRGDESVAPRIAIGIQPGVCADARHHRRDRSRGAEARGHRSGASSSPSRACLR